MLKQFQGHVTNTEQILKLYNNLFMYKILRLFIMLLILTYFIGCLWYMVSREWNPKDEDNTWYNDFIKPEQECDAVTNVCQPIEKINNFDKLVKSLYFALTMLSTVGYGDMYPVSNIE